MRYKRIFASILPVFVGGIVYLHFWQPRLSNQPQDRQPVRSSSLQPTISKRGGESAFQSRALDVLPGEHSSESSLRRVLASSHPDERLLELRRLLPILLKTDPVAASRFAEGMGAGDLRNEAMRLVAQDWGASDPQAAVAWAGRLTNDMERNAALADICSGQAILAPEKSVQLAVDLKLQSDSLLQNLIQQWASKDLAAASAWAKKQTVGEQRDQLLQRVAFIQSKTDPAAAARLVITQIPPGPAQTEAVITVINQWAQIDPSRAANWVARFPEGEVKSRAWGELRGFTR